MVFIEPDTALRFDDFGGFFAHFLDQIHKATETEKFRKSAFVYSCTAFADSLEASLQSFKEALEEKPDIQMACD